MAWQSENKGIPSRVLPTGNADTALKIQGEKQSG